MLEFNSDFLCHVGYLRFSFGSDLESLHLDSDESVI